MGFLFDEVSPTAQDDVEETARLWSELLELTVTGTPGVPPALDPPAAAAPQPATVLTKFRSRGAMPAARYIGASEAASGP